MAVLSVGTIDELGDVKLVFKCRYNNIVKTKSVNKKEKTFRLKFSFIVFWLKKPQSA